LAGPAADALHDKTFARLAADVQGGSPVPGALAAGAAPANPHGDESMPRFIISQIVWESSEFQMARHEEHGLAAERCRKVLVLDQFEQWLHARRNEENAELVQALRQCDGGRL
jgi:hypothetical protein